MKTKILAILLIVFGGIAGAASWTPVYNTGHSGGDAFPGPVTAYGLDATYAPTDVPNTNNGYGMVSIQTIAAAESSDDDQIKAAKTNEFNATTKFVLTTANGNFLAQPDVPRNIIVTMNNTATCDLKITGTDIAGAAITENLTWAAESGAKASTKAFKTVTRIDATSSVTTVQGKIGTGDLLGLNTMLSKNTVLFDFVGATRDTTAPSVTVNSTVVGLNTIDTYTAPGGSATMVWMVI